MKWSNQALAIFDHFRSGQSNLCVRARAGGGKTTVAIKGIELAPEKSILLAAFSARIARELKERLNNPHAQARTMHSIGYQAVRQYRGNVQVDENGVLGKQWAEKVCGCGFGAPWPARLLVMRLGTLIRECLPLSDSLSDIADLAWEHGCVPDVELEGYGWDESRIISCALKFRKAAEERCDLIDYTNMLYLPLVKRWLRPVAELGVFDEAQDLNAAQLLMAQKICSGRKVVIGDDRQAIFGFRGAASNSLDVLKESLGADELGLTATYRCSQAVVREAQQFVPDYVAGPDNPEGQVLSAGVEDVYEQARPGDFVLSRTNAPLVPICMGLIRQGTPARIEGRDVAKGIKALMDKLTKGAARDSLSAFGRQIDEWERGELCRLESSKAKAKASQTINIKDRADCLRAFAEESNSVSELKWRVDQLFQSTRSNDCVVCSTVHKAKGLERDRVWALRDTFNRRGSLEEQNITYVAITRARHTLVWVS